MEGKKELVDMLSKNADVICFLFFSLGVYENFLRIKKIEKSIKEAING